MKNNNEEICRRSQCAISIALETVGDKWSLLILRDLMFTGKRSYGELQSCDEKIATNILADRLKLLEANGFIKSTVSSEKKNKFIYSLTEKGIDLVPVIVELMIWGSKYNANEAKDVVKELEKDKEGGIRQLREKLLTRINSTIPSVI